MASRWLPVGVLGGFIALAVYYSLVIPPWEAVDEIDHYHYAQFLLTRHALPEQSTHGEPQEVLLAHHPPLYYLLVAAAIAPIDTSNPKESARVNTDFRWGDPNYGGYNRIFHGDASEQFPYSGATRGMHVARLLSVVAGALVLFATYQIARFFFGPQAFGLGALAMAIVGFIPGFLVTAATVHHDSWVAAFASLGLWRVLVFLRRPTTANIALCAALLGLTVLAKASGLALGLLLPFAAAMATWTSQPGTVLREPQHERMEDRFSNGGLRALASWMATAFGVYVGIAGWWLARNQILYGDPLGWGVFSTNPLWPIDPRPITMASLAMEFGAEWAPASDFWRTLMFGAGQMVFAHDLLLDTALLVVIVGLAGLGWAGWLARPGWRSWLPYVGTAALAVALVDAAIIRYSLSFFGPNGRYLFPALPMLVVAVIAGWRALLPRRTHMAVAAVLTIVVAGLAAFTPSWLFLPEYQLGQRLSAADAAALEPTVNIEFGELIRLVRANLTPLRADSGDSVHARLTWQALQDVPRSYRTFVHLVAFDGKTVAGIDRVPANGSASTGLWRQGDLIYDEFDVPIPAGASAGMYVATSGFYGFPDLARLPTTGPTAGGDVAILGRIKVLPTTIWASKPLTIFGDELGLGSATLGAAPASAGRDLTVQLLWVAQKQPSLDYTISVQLLARDGSLVAQHDSPPLGGALPTSDWVAGDVIPDEVHLSIPPAALYPLTIDLIVYESSTGKRLSMGVGDTYQIGRVESPR